MHSNTFAFLATILFSASLAAEWQPLFNGQDLEGWKQLGGEARYEVEGDAIVGYTAADTPNSFLTTQERYSDFIFEYEMYIDPAMNSGVQIRSNTRDDGVVHGYQVEADPSARRFTGGIFDEQRRGWLSPLSRNEKGREAFENGKWNHFRVEAIGHSIQVWVNGIQTAALVDDMTDSGFIGLQVHSIGSPDMVGRNVRWRNIRILTKDLEANRTPRDPEVVEISYLENQLTEYEKRQGWRRLWDV